MESQFFRSAVEVAAYLNKSPKTIRRWVAACRIPYCRTADGQTFFHREAIAAWIRSGFCEPLPPQRTRKRAAAVPLSPSILPEPQKPRGQKRTRNAALPPNIPAP